MAEIISDELTAEQLELLMRNPYYNPDEHAAVLVRSKEQTIIIVAHIRKQLDEWTLSGDKSGLIRQKMIQGLYMDKRRTTLKELSEKENIPIQTLSEELKKAKQQLSTRVFGVDGTLHPEPEGSILQAS
jgi:hypothetical protein